MLGSLTVIPKVALRKELQKGELEPLVGEGEMEMSILMVRHEKRWGSPILSAFIETARSEMRGI